MRAQLSSYVAELDLLFSKGEFGAILSSLVKAGNVLSKDVHLWGKLFGSAALDGVCIRVGQKIAKAALISPISKNSTGPVIYLATSMNEEDRHRSILTSFLNCEKLSKKIIILSNINNEVNTGAIGGNLQPNYCDDIVVAPPSLSLAEKLKWIMNTIASLKPSKVFLFNHPDDAVIVAATAILDSVPLYFHHHWDQAFSYGLYCRANSHIDTRQPSNLNCSFNLQIENTATVYPTVALRTEAGTAINFEPKILSLQTATCGNEINFEFETESGLPAVIAGILKTTKGNHVHIGRLSPVNLSNIENALTKSKIKATSFVHIQQTADLGATLRSLEISFLIDSFPICDSLAVTQSLSVAIPVIGFFGNVPYLFSSKNQLQEGAYIWKAPQELFDYLGTIDDERLRTQRISALRYFEAFHSTEVMEKRYRELKPSGSRPIEDELLPLRASDVSQFDHVESFHFESEISNKIAQLFDDLTNFCRALGIHDNLEIRCSNSMYTLLSSEPVATTEAAKDAFKSETKFAKIRRRLRIGRLMKWTRK